MRKIFGEMKAFLESKVITRILAGVGIFIIALLIFAAGVSVGFHRASFGRAWDENYERNFGFPGGHTFSFNQERSPNSHGAAGRIIKIELPTIIVEDRDNIEKVVLINNDTKLQRMMSEIKSSDLALNDFVVVIGSPNDQGQIEAKFIRVMPQGMPSRFHNQINQNQ